VYSPAEKAPELLYREGRGLHSCSTKKSRGAACKREGCSRLPIESKVGRKWTLSFRKKESLSFSTKDAKQRDFCRGGNKERSWRTILFARKEKRNDLLLNEKKKRNLLPRSNRKRAWSQTHNKRGGTDVCTGRRRKASSRRERAGKFFLWELKWKTLNQRCKGKSTEVSSARLGTTTLETGGRSRKNEESGEEKGGTRDD